MKIIVVDPRRTDTAEIADLYLPIQPGTDVMLFHGMLHVMLWEGWTDAGYIAAHTSGFDALQGRGARLHARAGGADLRHRARTTWCSRGALVRHLAGHAVPVLPGPEPVHAAAPRRTRR